MNKTNKSPPVENDFGGRVFCIIVFPGMVKTIPYI